MKICKGCGKEFEPKFKNQVYCDFFCRKEFTRKHYSEIYKLKKENPNIQFMTKCLHCGKEFKTEGARKYCSKECIRLHRNLTRKKVENKGCKKVKVNTKPIKNTFKIGEFIIKIIPNNIGYYWEAYKNDKKLLESANSFISREGCLKDANKAFRG